MCSPFKIALSRTWPIQQMMALAAVLYQFLHWCRLQRFGFRRLMSCWIQMLHFHFVKVVRCLSPLMFSSVLCVRPAHPPPFKPPFTMTIAACWDPFSCIALTTAGYWQGPIHCCNPPQTIKTLANQLGPPLTAITHLLCLLAILPGEGGRVEQLGLCTWFCQRWKRRGMVLCTQ